MTTRMRTTALLTAVLFSFGLTSCSGDTPTEDKKSPTTAPTTVTSDTPSDEAEVSEEPVEESSETSDTPKPDPTKDTIDVASFQGSWELIPSEPHSTLVMTIASNGKVTVKKTKVNDAATGTLEASKKGTFVITLQNPEGGGETFVITLSPTSDSDSWKAAYEGDKNATFERT